MNQPFFESRASNENSKLLQNPPKATDSSEAPRSLHRNSTTMDPVRESHVGIRQLHP